MIAYVCDGELVCEDCAVDVTDDEMAIGGESDSPSHCSYCHCPLFDVFGLTDEGQRYVLAAVRKSLKKGKAHANAWHWEHGYYKGQNRDAVLLDWCDELRTWKLDKRDQRTVDLFVQWRTVS